MKQKVFKKVAVLLMSLVMVFSVMGTMPAKAIEGEEGDNPPASEELTEAAAALEESVVGELEEDTNAIELAGDEEDGCEKVYKFIPTQTAKYFIYSNTYDADLEAFLYDGQGTLLQYNNEPEADQYEEEYPLYDMTCNFFLVEELTQGSTYYVKIANLDEKGTFDIVCGTSFEGFVDESDFEFEGGQDGDIEGFDVYAYVDGNPVDSEEYYVGYNKDDSVELSAKVFDAKDNKELAQSKYTVKWFKETDDEDRKLVSSDYTYTFKKSDIEEYFYCVVTIDGKSKEIEINFAATDSISTDAKVTDVAGNPIDCTIEVDEDGENWTDATAKVENGDDVILTASATSILAKPNYTFTWYNEDDEEIQATTYDTKTASDSYAVHKTEIEEYYYCQVSDGNSSWIVAFYLESNSKITYTASWKINDQESVEEVVTSSDAIEMKIAAENAENPDAEINYEWYYQSFDEEEYELAGMFEKDGKTYYFADYETVDFENADEDDLELMPFHIIDCKGGTLKVTGIIDECMFYCDVTDEDDMGFEIPFMFYPTSNMNITAGVHNETKNTTGNKNDVGDMMKLSVSPSLNGEDISNDCSYQWYYYDEDYEGYDILEGETDSTYNYQIFEQVERYRCLVTKKDGTERQPYIFTIYADPEVKYGVSGKINGKAETSIVADYKSEATLSVDIDSQLAIENFRLRWFDQNGKMIANSADKQSVKVEVTKDMNYYCMIYFGKRTANDKYPKRVDFSIKLKVADTDKGVCKHKNVELVDVEKATCNKAGYTGNKHCKDCNQIIEKGKAMATVPHTWNGGVQTVAPTAVTAGTKTFTCSVCHATRNEVIPAKGLPSAGAQMTVSGGKYKVVSADATNPTVEYVKPSSAKATVTIPDTVTFDGATYKVVSIAAKAFKKNKKLTKVTIGKNIKKIGKEAFYGCKKLKTVNVKTKSLGKKSIGKNAFKGIHKKAVVKVPKKQLKNYKKYFKKAGVKGKTQKIKK